MYFYFAIQSNTSYSMVATSGRTWGGRMHTIVMYTDINYFDEGTVFRRQILTSKDGPLTGRIQRKDKCRQY